MRNRLRNNSSKNSTKGNEKITKDKEVIGTKDLKYGVVINKNICIIKIYFLVNKGHVNGEETGLKISDETITDCTVLAVMFNLNDNCRRYV